MHTHMHMIVHVCDHLCAHIILVHLNQILLRLIKSSVVFDAGDLLCLLDLHVILYRMPLIADVALRVEICCLLRAFIKSLVR